MTDSEAKALRALIEGETDDDLVELDPRWEQYAAGTLPAAEVEALRREAADSELQAVAVEALAPLGDAVKGRITEFAGTHYRKDTNRSNGTNRREAAERSGAGVAWRGWWAGLAALLAGAVAVLLVVPRSPPEEGVAYEAVWRSGEQVVRSAEEEPTELPTFVAGSRLQLDLQPETTPEAAPTVFVALGTWDSPLEGVDTVTAYGVIRIEGVIGADPWALDPGEHTLLVAIGPPGSAPPRGTPPAGFQTFSQRFVVAPHD